jgi:hypothetical protein
MYIYETFDPNPFRVNAYRTDEVLFLHIASHSWAKYIRQIRFTVIIYGCPFLFFIFVSLYNARFTEAVGLFGVGIGMVGVLSFCYYLLAPKQLLIRIDRNTIHKTSWYFGIGIREMLIRPHEILFNKRDGQWHLVAGERFMSLNVRDHELQWIDKIIEQFENEVPVLAAETESKTISISENREVESGLRVLEDMEYQGQKLRKIPNPTEQYLFNYITKNNLPNELPGTFHVRCSYCNSQLPTDYVFTDTALAQCPCCGSLFEVDDLKRYPPPLHSSIKIQTEENVLKLHQHPQFFNILSFYFFLFYAIISIDLVLAAFYVYILQINPAATLQEIGIILPNGNLALWVFTIVTSHFFCFLLFLWSIFVHRFVEFRLHEVYFRIRWLCFWRSWTVPRSRLGSCRLTLFSLTLNLGFQIPYGKKSFPIGATKSEIPWVVGEINHWLLTHPPDESPISDNFPRFENTAVNSFSKEPDNPTIGGLGEHNSNKEIRCHCDTCGHRFLTEELDFPNRNAFCPNCNKTFNLSQLRYYTVKPMATKPELPQLLIKESETEHQIEFSTIPMKRLEKITNCLGLALISVMLVFFVGSPIYPYFVALANKQGMDFIIFLVGIPMLLLVCLPYLLVFFGVSSWMYDQYRQKFTAWTTQFSDGYFELTRRYKNRSETIRFETNRIVRFQRGGTAKNWGESMKNYPFFGRFPSNLENRGSIRNEMILTDGTIIYLPILSELKKSGTWNNWLVNTWNEQLCQLYSLHS